MVSINYATREVSCKIVYYGPGLSGKTTNLQYVHQKVPPNTKGKLISLATDADRTLYFDFLPINIGAINGFAAKFQLYTVPGQVYYNATRKLVLRGVDGLVFVADSQPDKMDENIESLNNLKENLAEYGYRLEELPIVLQYNKQDLPNVMRAEQMRPILNPRGWPEFGASATNGTGVFDTLKCILKLVLDKAKTGGPATVPSQQPTAVTPSAALEREPVQVVAAPRMVPRPEPVSQPVGATAPLSAGDEEPTPVREPVTAASETPMPETVEQNDVENPVTSQQKYTHEHESGADSVKTERPVYRPFPGNTFEEEERMRRQRHREEIRRDEPVKSAERFAEGSAPVSTMPTTADTYSGLSTTGQPRMAPSLKADKPRKRRSFFKRLFGLK